MKKKLPLLVIASFLILYILGATASSSIDAWAYASNIKYGNNLLRPHHLLYNVLGYAWTTSLGSIIPLETLQLMKLMNAIFATMALLVLWRILKELKTETNAIPWLLVFAGASWSVMRFATDNETYIVPLIFSLLGSLYFIRWTASKASRHIIASGLFAATATLFHQVMLFWWLALLIGVLYRKKLYSVSLFIAPTIIVPIAYAIAVYIEFEGLNLSLLVNYALSDYTTGAADISVGSKSFLLLAIGLFRSFFQVHGYIANLLYQSAGWRVGGIVATLLLLYGLFRCTRTFPKFNGLNSNFTIHLVALVLQMIFATLSFGNVEFLVMVPFLVTILLANFRNLNAKVIAPIALGMLVWNINFGVVPLKLKPLDGSSMVANHILSNNNSCNVYILHSKPRIENEVIYTGGNYLPTLIKASDFSSATIDTLLQKGYNVYTDILSRPKVYSREYMIGQPYNASYVLDGLIVSPVCTQTSLCGRFTLYKIVHGQ